MSVAGDELSEDERTTRVRIRDAAMRQFAELGFKGATVRGIARSAGVSPGLVQHHFPSKEDLREACDARVVAFMEEVKDRELAAGPDSADVLATAFESGPLIVRYLASAVASGSDTAQAWFEELAGIVKSAIINGDVGHGETQGHDIEAIAAVQAAMLLGLVVSYHRLVSLLGATGGEQEAVARIAKARVVLAPRGFSDVALERMRASVESYEATLRTADRHPGSPPRRRRAR